MLYFCRWRWASQKGSSPSRPWHAPSTSAISFGALTLRTTGCSSPTSTSSYDMFSLLSVDYAVQHDVLTSIRMPMLWKCFGKCDDGGTYTPATISQISIILTSSNDVPGSTVITIPACRLSVHISSIYSEFEFRQGRTVHVDQSDWIRASLRTGEPISQPSGEWNVPIPTGCPMKCGYNSVSRPAITPKSNPIRVSSLPSSSTDRWCSCASERRERAVQRATSCFCAERSAP